MELAPREIGELKRCPKFRNMLQLATSRHKGGCEHRKIHTPGPAEKAGKSSKSITKSADASPHKEAVVVAAVLEAVNVFDSKREDNAPLEVS